ncbi:bifunctional folylpolyglutamate synthase/dihydrofolate synthase [Lactiplantibacillus pentosus]|uniref:bifunctional folylpolyglutamate synthase/dihydrofolate synthase n=1 Tax=Lactiplantibacillus pentosus TaxID=1589 RepID=UPI000C7D2EA0|nr:folylpolyglutamate synthase/dihydrofolate synthase family protein [Lactiplantibacillus pentosus]AUI78266.1 bifunctional folylpolyglutamate synthase/dihydrofolate synthase [Lactiplantibacillus pentosus]MBU7464647.1 bifunctional folylpolyglutamate synthase/dihydrofolate synthase [Lactiplantibacillus pentosus]MBU7489960.1 bifunctional folylpolyglutamate synthase/dihydrofolate synthase [Lactiplantibacillus pentosus]MBU7493867.1 bifunctional folylpolyglutamate synthase/dihydrofolate synthase [Lac
MIETYSDALAFIHGRTKFKKAPTLQRMRQFLHELGDPQLQVHGIHVAGTNGKGSTVANLRELFMADGLTVGTFTSPFITRFNERISVDGTPISDTDLVELVQQVQPVVAKLDATLESGGPTEFEIITAMMFLYFAAQPIDIAIIEVGLGGLYDSTNVWTPAVSVITTIGYDHMQILGDTLTAIATQKAGIIKPQIPVVVGKLPAEAQDVMVQTAADQQAPLQTLDVDFTTKLLAPQGWQERFNFDGLDEHFKDLTTPLLGDYQVDNAAVALAAYLTYHQQTQVPVSASDVKKALAGTQWPGRFERLNADPLIMIDGAHNEPAITELAATLRERFGQQTVYVIFAVLADKQHQQMIQTLGALPNVHLLLAQFAGPNAKRQATDPSTLAAEMPSGHSAAVFDNWQAALMQALQEMSSDDVLLLTGSLYFISDVRAYFKQADAD